MSQYIELDGETLWNPSNGVARVFLAQLALHEAQLELPSGIGPMADDEAPVDPAALRAFVTALVDRHAHSAHPVLLALSEGFVATALVLAERAGVGVPEATPERHLRAARELGRAMGR